MAEGQQIARFFFGLLLVQVRTDAKRYGDRDRERERERERIGYAGYETRYERQMRTRKGAQPWLKDGEGERDSN